MTGGLPQSHPRIVGIDPSLTGTGLAVIHGDFVMASTVKPGSLRSHERLQFVIEKVAATVLYNCDLVVIEGPSYGSVAGQSGHHERAGLWWAITQMLWRNGVPYAVASPASRAMYATGAGNAGKQLVIDCMDARFPAVKIKDDNQADALTLACMGADYLGVDVPAGPPRGRQAMKKVKWPPLPRDEA